MKFLSGQNRDISGHNAQLHEQNEKESGHKEFLSEQNNTLSGHKIHNLIQTEREGGSRHL